jgi:hypothetical protein
MSTFIEALRTQRWDDHRYYHQSRINQSLHLVSALSFLAAYLLLFFDPVMAGLTGWLVSMGTRQAGHFFFEPKTYDHINQATHERKEAIKVGYNLHRKIVLILIWASSPLLLFADPTVLGLLTPYGNVSEFIRSMAKIWLAVGMGALLFRVVQLFFLYNIQTGLVWLTKIITDPFHDVMLYYKAPLALLRGELYDTSMGRHGRAQGVQP